MRQCSKCKLPIGAREGWTRVLGQPIHRTCQDGVVARFLVRVKDDLVVNGETLSITASVHNAYKSPGYVDSHRPSWLIVASGKVVEVFSEDVELLSVSSIREDEVPQSVLEYTVPDHRGFTTMPYQVDR